MGLFKKRNETGRIFRSVGSLLHYFGLIKRKPFCERHAIHFLNGAQFLGVVNDNFFKYLIVFLFIDLKGAEDAPTILMWVGIIYVLPFLFFSSGAGILADKFSKQRMIIALKLSEVIIMALGVVAFFVRSVWGSYTLLFLLSTQSAIFGPPKYSIIPELVKEKYIPKANGLITSCTYLGIIVGTFLASFLTQITEKNFPLTAGVGTVFALFGLLASAFIPKKASAKRGKEKINPFFFYEVYKNLVHASKTPYLLTAIFGSASFLFIGAYFQLNAIPYAMQSLSYTEVAGGYLFLVTAMGIALGALLAGKLCRQKVEIGLACLSGLALSFFVLFLGIFYHFPLFIFAALFFLGIFGGLYIVPFDSFIQQYATQQKRGQMIAAANFLSFCGVFIAPILLFILSEWMKLSAAKGFVIIGIVIFFFTFSLTCKLSGFFFNYLARIFSKLIGTIEIKNFPKESERPFVLIGEKKGGLPIALLALLSSELHFYIAQKRKKRLSFFAFFFSSIHSVSCKDFYGDFLQAVAETSDLSGKRVPCLIVSSFAQLEKREKTTSKLPKSLSVFFVQINIAEKKEERRKRIIFTCAKKES